MRASYRQPTGFQARLIRPRVLLACAGNGSRPGLTFQSTTPTLQFESADAVLRTLRQRGLRISTARRVIVNHLFETDAPVSAQQIAAGLWELDKVMAKGDPLTVRAALGQLIDRIEIEVTAKPIISRGSHRSDLPVQVRREDVRGSGRAGSGSAPL